MDCCSTIDDESRSERNICIVDCRFIYRERKLGISVVGTFSGSGSHIEL